MCDCPPEKHTKQQLLSFEKTKPVIGKRQREVIEMLKIHPRGLSAWEIASFTDRMIHTVRPRISELRKLGIVKQSGDRYEPETDRHEAVWVLNEEAA